MKSIQRRLVAWLLLVLLAGALVTGAFVYRQAREAANAMFDYQLRQVAQSLPARAFGPLSQSRQGLPEAEDGVVVEIWTLSGRRLYISHPDSQLPASAQLGFSTTGSAQGDWRVYAAIFEDVLIEVAQPMRVRRELAAAIALRTVLPVLVLLPVLGVLIWLIVGRGLLPVRRVAEEVAARRPGALAPLAVTGLPDEIRPLVAALNDLLARLARALESERNFIADAAHEMRTPLTALQLHVQLAERAESPEQVRAELGPLRAGLARVAHLVEQLLALARAEPEVPASAMREVDLLELARAVIVANTARALERQLDLGLVAETSLRVEGDPEALDTLLTNLVDNALRYTPAGGRIDVELIKQDGVAELAVTDTGPGIPEAERERVFARFYRGDSTHSPGSGLGLAIVRNIAARHGATVVLETPATGAGLTVRVSFKVPARESQLP